MIMMKYPFVQQEGAKDCGVCSLLMILKFYGGSVSKEYLRELSKTTKKGVNASNLKRAAEQCGLEMIGVKGHVSKLTPSDLPCIAHVVIDSSYSHFLVIYQKNDRNQQLLIADPATGIKRMKYSEFEKISSKVFLLCTPKRKLDIIENEKMLKKKILEFVLKNKKVIIMVGLFSILFTSLNILTSFQFELLLEYFIPYSTRLNLQYLIIFFALVIVSKIALEYYRNFLFNYLDHSLSREMITDIYHHILSLPHLYYKNRTTGEIISRIQDIETVKATFSKIFIYFLIDMLLILLSLSVLLILNLRLTMIVLIIFILSFSCIQLFKKILAEYIKKGKEYASEANSYLTETILGIETAKELHIEEKIINIFNQRYNHYNKVSYRYNTFYNYQLLLKNIIEEYGTFLVLIVGSVFVQQEIISLGTLLTYQSIMGYFLSPIQNMSDLAIEYRQMKVALERLDELYDVIPEDLEKGLIKEINDINRIDLENIHYTYNGKDEVLKNVNLTLMKGERILIYGLSGSGKSTLARLLTGVLNADQGKIKINDIELINYSLDCLRNNICYVSQNEQLFTASIYENVCLTDNGDTETSSNQFLKVCQLCKVDEIAAKSPLAYQLPLEENGFNISGGERQRIILARALLKNAKCYIFDESMNEIDIHREREILKALFQEYPNKIFIMISHRYHNSDLFYQKYQLINGEFYVKRAQYDTSR